MHADVLGISGNASMIETGNGTAYVDIEVIATGGSPVPGATVLLRGNNVTASGVTDDDGKVVLEIDRSAILLDIEEGYLQLIAKAEGYMEYSNEHAVKVIRP